MGRLRWDIAAYGSFAVIGVIGLTLGHGETWGPSALGAAALGSGSYGFSRWIEMRDRWRSRDTVQAAVGGTDAPEEGPATQELGLR